MQKGSFRVTPLPATGSREPDSTEGGWGWGEPGSRESTEALPSCFLGSSSLSWRKLHSKISLGASREIPQSHYFPAPQDPRERGLRPREGRPRPPPFFVRPASGAQGRVSAGRARSLIRSMCGTRVLFVRELPPCPPQLRASGWRLVGAPEAAPSPPAHREPLLQKTPQTRSSPPLLERAAGVPTWGPLARVGAVPCVICAQPKAGTERQGGVPLVPRLVLLPGTPRAAPRSLRVSSSNRAEPRAARASAPAPSPPPIPPPRARPPAHKR